MRSRVALALFLVVTACSAGGSDTVSLGGVTLIRHGGGDEYPSALGIGVLAVTDACVSLDGDGGDPAFVLWPPGFDLQEGPGGLMHVVDGSGDPVGAIGDPVTLGGGYMELETAQSLTDHSVPTLCRVSGERYFIAGSVVEP